MGQMGHMGMVGKMGLMGKMGPMGPMGPAMGKMGPMRPMGPAMGKMGPMGPMGLDAITPMHGQLLMHGSKFGPGLMHQPAMLKGVPGVVLHKGMMGPHNIPSPFNVGNQHLDFGEQDHHKGGNSGRAADACKKGKKTTVEIAVVDSEGESLPGT